MTTWGKNAIIAYGKYYGYTVGKWDHKQPSVNTVTLLGSWSGPMEPYMQGGSFPWTGPVHEMHLHEPDLVYDVSFFGSEQNTPEG
jgi:hypothetical protein